MPEVDLTPPFDTAVFARLIDYSAAMPKIDFGRLLEGLDLPQFTKAYPSNWPPDLHLDVAAEIFSGRGDIFETVEWLVLPGVAGALPFALVLRGARRNGAGGSLTRSVSP